MAKKYDTKKMRGTASSVSAQSTNEYDQQIYNATDTNTHKYNTAAMRAYGAISSSQKSVEKAQKYFSGETGNVGTAAEWLKDTSYNAANTQHYTDLINKAGFSDEDENKYLSTLSEYQNYNKQVGSIVTADTKLSHIAQSAQNVSNELSKNQQIHKSGQNAIIDAMRAQKKYQDVNDELNSYISSLKQSGLSDADIGIYTEKANSYVKSVIGENDSAKQYENYLKDPEAQKQREAYDSSPYREFDNINGASRVQIAMHMAVANVEKDPETAKNYASQAISMYQQQEYKANSDYWYLVANGTEAEIADARARLEDAKKKIALAEDLVTSADNTIASRSTNGMDSVGNPIISAGGNVGVALRSANASMESDPSAAGRYSNYAYTTASTEENDAQAAYWRSVANGTEEEIQAAKERWDNAKNVLSYAKYLNDQSQVPAFEANASKKADPNDETKYSYDSSIEDSTYRHVNTDSGSSKYSYMTADERKVYNITYVEDGAEAANRYIDLIQPKLNQRKTQAATEAASDFSEDHQIVASAGSILMTPATVVTGAVDAAKGIDNLLGGRNDIDTNDSLHRINKVKSAIRSEVSSDMSEVGKQAYSITMGAFDNAINLAVGGVASKAVGAALAASNFVVGLMGMEVVGDTVISEIAKGRSDTEAACIGIVRGLIEGVTEYVSIESILANPSTFLQSIGKSFVSEGSEEVASNFLNNIVDVITKDPDGVYTEYKRKLDSGIDSSTAFSEAVVRVIGEDTTAFLQGGFAGLAMSGTSNAIGIKQNHLEIEDIGKKYNDVSGDLINEASELSPDSKLTKYAEKRMASGKKISNYKLGQLTIQNEKEIKEGDYGKINSAVESRLRDLGDTGYVRMASNAITKKIMGMPTTEEDSYSIAASGHGQQVLDELSQDNVTSGNADSAWAKKIETDRFMPDVYTENIESGRSAARNVVAQPTFDNPVTAALNRKNVSALGDRTAVIIDSGDQVEVTGLSYSPGSNKVFVITKGADGTTKQVPTSSVQMSDSTDRLVQLSSKYGAAAPYIFQIYKNGQSLDQYEDGADYVYSWGKASSASDGVKALKHVQNGAKQYGLTDWQVNELFRQGRLAGQTETAKSRTEKQGDGSLTFDFDVSEKKLTDRQQSEVEVMRKLAKLTGLKFSVFESTVDENGVRSGKNGSYEKGVIEVDLNAGMYGAEDFESQSMLRTVSHELTHFISEQNPKTYKELQTFLLDHLSEWDDEKLDHLVKTKQARTNSNISYSDALEEVVSDGCEMMLKDSQVVQRLAKTSKGLFDTIREFIRDFCSKVRAAFRGVNAKDAAAKYMEQYAADLQKVWDNALVGAVENYNNSDAKASEDAEAPQKKLSERDNEYMDAVNSDDMDTAQNMVDEAARAAMPDSKILDENGNLQIVYHGTDQNFTEFDRTKSRANMDIQGNFFSPWDIDAKGYGINVRAFYLNISNPADESTAYRTLNRFKGQNEAGIKARDLLIQMGYDGVNNSDEEYIAFDPNQIKSADPVTYDDSGNVIPLSERFNSEKDDIRFSERDQLQDQITALESEIKEIEKKSVLAGQMHQGAKDAATLRKKEELYAGNIEKRENQITALQKQIKEAQHSGVLAGQIYQGSKDAAEIRKLNDRLDVYKRDLSGMKDMLLETQNNLSKLERISSRAQQTIEKKQQQLEKLKAQQQERFKEYRENRNESESVKRYRDRVKVKADTLTKWLLTNSDKEHIPESLKAPLAKFLQTVNTTSQRQLKGGSYTKADISYSQTLDKVRQILANQMNYMADPDKGGNQMDDYLDLPADFVDKIQEHINIAQKIAEGTDVDSGFVNQMNSDQLKDLDFILTTLTKSIRQINKLVANGRYQTVTEASGATIHDLNQLGQKKWNRGATDYIEKYLKWTNLTPYYAFNRYGNGGKAIFSELQDGMDKRAFNLHDVVDFSKSAYTEKEVHEWSRDVKDIELESGKTVKMTPAQIMSLYALSKREQAVGHLLGGGARVETIKVPGKISIAQATPYILTVKDIDTLKQSLSDRQREVSEKLQDYMGTAGSNWGNAVSMARFGYRAFTDDNYFPMESEKNNLPAKDPDTQNSGMFRLINMSFTKSTVEKANNALVIRNIFDVFSNHMTDMATYNSMVLPLLDAMKWYNYMDKTVAEDGHVTTKSVKEAMEKSYGRDANNYFITLMKDLNGAKDVGRGEGFASKMISNAKISMVAANLRVAFLQPVSYLRAADVISPKYLTESAALSSVQLRKLAREVKQYSGIALWKSMGFFDTDVSRGIREQIKHDTTLKNKIQEASMKLAEQGDTITWAVMWNACKLEAADKQKLSGDALIKAATIRFREVIYATQVVDSILTRSHMMRSNSLYTKITTAFMSEPTMSYNMALNAYMDFNDEKRKTGSAKEAWKRVGGHVTRAISTYCIASIGAAIVESLFSAFRDDDDKKYINKFLESLFGTKEKFFTDGNLWQDLSILNKLSIPKDIISVLSGYDSQRLDTQWATNFKKTVELWVEFTKLATGQLDRATATTYYGNMTNYGMIFQTLTTISQLTGLPFSSATREVVTIWNSTAGALGIGKKVKTYDSKTDHYDLMYTAVTSGNMKTWETEYKSMLDTLTKKETTSDAKSEIQQSMSKRVNAAFLSGKIDSATAEQYLQNFCGKRPDDAAATVLQWSCKLDTKIAYDDIGKTYVSGGLTAEDAAGLLETYGSVSEEDATAKVLTWQMEKDTGIKFDDLEDAYLDDEVTQENASAYLQQYGGKEAVVAESTVLEWQMEKDTGIKFGDLKQTYIDGQIDENTTSGYLKQYGQMDEEKTASTMNKWNLEKETGITSIEGIKTAYVEGDITDNSAIDLKVRYSGLSEEDAEDTILKWSFEKKNGYPLTDLSDKFVANKVSENEALNALVNYSGKTQDEAKDTVTKWRCEKETGVKYDDIIDTYLAGKMSDSKAISLFQKYGGLSEEKATGKVTTAAFVKKNPDCEGISAEAVSNYESYCEGVGVSVKSFFDTWKFTNSTDADVDADGNAISGSKRDKVLSYINGLSISSEQKDALYYASGYAKSKIKYAPWH